jgi:hypothetical protein
LTGRADNPRMKAFAATLAACLAALALAQSGSAGPGELARLLAGPVVRAEVVVVENGVVHDYRIDRGALRAVGASGVTLLERDGSTVVVPVAPGARIVVGRRAVPLALLRRAVGRRVTTVRDRDAAATIVQVGK